MAFIMQENSQTENKSTELLFDKHVSYVANHGNDKNDFVSKKLQFPVCKLRLTN